MMSRRRCPAVGTECRAPPTRSGACAWLSRGPIGMPGASSRGARGEYGPSSSSPSRRRPSVDGCAAAARASARPGGTTHRGRPEAGPSPRPTGSCTSSARNTRPDAPARFTEASVRTTRTRPTRRYSRRRRTRLLGLLRARMIRASAVMAVVGRLALLVALGIWDGGTRRPRPASAPRSPGRRGYITVQTAPPTSARRDRIDLASGWTGDLRSTATTSRGQLRRNDPSPAFFQPGAGKKITELPPAGSRSPPHLAPLDGSPAPKAVRAREFHESPDLRLRPAADHGGNKHARSFRCRRA